MSFELTLPGGGGEFLGGIVAIGEQLPSNLFASAAAAKCPYCGSEEGVLVWDHPNYGELTDHDLDAIRDLWRFRCQIWWRQKDRSGALCDHCSTPITQGQGYHKGSQVVCKACAASDTRLEALSDLKRDPDYFGKSELRRARNFKLGCWRFEPARRVTKTDEPVK